MVLSKVYPLIFCVFATHWIIIWISEIIEKRQFSGNMILADVRLVFKKETRNLVKNYRPLTVLTVISKI